MRVAEALAETLTDAIPRCSAHNPRDDWRGAVVGIIIDATERCLLGRRWSPSVSHAWTVKDCAGHVVPDFTGPSRFDVGRRLVSTPYDAFRLQVSHSYLQMFDRELAKVLSDKCWQIIRIRAKTSRTNAPRAGAQGSLFAH